MKSHPVSSIINASVPHRRVKTQCNPNLARSLEGLKYIRNWNLIDSKLVGPERVFTKKNYTIDFGL
jgi:hypothetical protein